MTTYEILITAWFFGTIILAVGANCYEPARKVFVAYAILTNCVNPMKMWTRGTAYSGFPRK